MVRSAPCSEPGALQQGTSAHPPFYLDGSASPPTQCKAEEKPALGKGGRRKRSHLSRLACSLPPPPPRSKSPSSPFALHMVHPCCWVFLSQANRSALFPVLAKGEHLGAPSA